MSTVSAVRDDHAAGARYIGPFTSRRRAEQAAEALAEALPLRTCTQTLGVRPKASACVLADLGRCPAPCVGGTTPEQYAHVVERARTALTADPQEVISALNRRMAALADQERYEEAGAWRDRLSALLRAVELTAVSDLLGQTSQIVAARPTDDMGWEVHVIRHGRLAAAGIIPPRTDPTAPLAELMRAAEHVDPPMRPCGAALAEETQLLARWLFSPGVRLVHHDGPPMALPRAGAAGHRATYDVDQNDPVPAGMVS